MKSYLFTIGKDKFEYKNERLKVDDFGKVKVFSDNIPDDDLGIMMGKYRAGKLNEFLDTYERNHFLLAFYDYRKSEFYIYNDHFGSNEIFWHKKGEKVWISDFVKNIFRESGLKMEIVPERVHELLAFNSICPPRTIYKNLACLPGGKFLGHKNISIKICKFFDINKLFYQKSNNYNLLVKRFRKKIEKKMYNISSKNLGIALSGGIDSGGLLSMLSKTKQISFTSFSLGAYGKKSFDLVSVRKIAKYNKSKNSEIYPKVSDLEKMKIFCEDLNQPFFPHNIFFNSLILETAKNKGIDKIIYGFGTNLVLGTQRINKAAYYLEKIEKIIPRSFLNFIYSIIAKNDNEKRFYKEKNWTKRWLYVKSPLLIHEKFFYKNFNEKKFIDKFEKVFKEVFFNSRLSLNDKIIIAEFLGWPMQSQFSHVYQICRKFNIKPVLPFEELCLLKYIFTATDKVRKKNKWQKQIVRDIFKPYVTEELYKNKPKAVIIPYTKWFNKNYSTIIKYIKDVEVLNGVIAWNIFENNYEKMQDPGFTLMKLFGFAVWYNVNWQSNKINDLSKLF